MLGSLGASAASSVAALIRLVDSLAAAGILVDLGLYLMLSKVIVDFLMLLLMIGQPHIDVVHMLMISRLI